MADSNSPIHIADSQAEASSGAATMPLDGEMAAQRRERLERERDALLEQEELEKLEEQVSTLRIR